MKLASNISQFVRLRNFNTKKFNYSPALFVIGKPNVGKTSFTIPVSEHYNLYPIYIRHYVDALSRLEIMKYLLNSINNLQIQSRLKFLIDHETDELNNQWCNLIRGRHGIKKRIQLNNLLKSIGLDTETLLKDAINKFPEEFKYTQIYSKHEMQTKSCNLLDNKVVREVLDNMIKNVQHNLMSKFKGIIIDGYPISEDQAKILIETCLKYSFKPVIALEINIPDEELYKNVAQNKEVNKSLLSLEDKEPQYSLDVLKKRLKIYHENIDSVKNFLTKNNIYVYQLNVPNTHNTFRTEYQVFTMIDKLFSKYFSDSY